MPVDLRGLEQLRDRLSHSSGAEAGRWLDDLPERIAAAEARHGIVLGGPFAALSYNYVAPCTGRGGPLVAKLHRPGDREARSEAAALGAFGGDGAVRLLEHDEDLGLMLLEHSLPGTSVAALPDAEATDVAGALLARLHRAAVPAGAIALRDWLASLWEVGDSVWPGIRRRAEDLLATSPEPVLLHGDLHHANVLRSGDGWVSIDPKGLIGDRAFDAVMWLANEIDVPEPVARTEVRVARLGAALGCEPERIVAWAVVQSVLSACWALDDGADPGGCLAHARMVAQALPKSG